MMDDEYLDERDEALLAELRGAAARLDPVPDIVLRAAHHAIELRDLDAQLAELLSDSAAVEAELAGIRGGTARMLTFGVGDRFIEIEISGTAATRDVTGYVVPAAAGAIVAESPESEVGSDIDAQGRFRITGIPTGPARFRIALPGAPALVTPWTAF